MHELSQSDIDAAWQFMLAAAPSLAASPDLLTQEGFLSSVALNAAQARLALRLGSEYVPARKDCLEAVTALSDSVQQVAQLTDRAARSLKTVERMRRAADLREMLAAEPALPPAPEGFCRVQLLGDLEPRLVRISLEAAEGASRPDQSAPARSEQPCGPVEPAAKG
ncbi:MAG: hypothetical protein RL299_1985 [Pseudomonadota bacterium]|jgi:hypothetical protein